MSARTAFPDSLDPTTLWALRAVLVPMHPTIASHPDLKAITVFLAATATPARGGLAYLDAVLPAEHRLAATRVVRDLGALPPDAILYRTCSPYPPDRPVSRCGGAVAGATRRRDRAAA